jgi:hypothetical protein
VKENVGLDAQAREPEDKTLMRRSGGTPGLSLLVGSLGSLNRFGGLSSQGSTSAGGSERAREGGVVSHELSWLQSGYADSLTFCLLNRL